ncbi:hypothetical protein [Agromyces arachidis]|uniref:hypothetical protein n=1 Tax=Agromyces arachidis TaxID=766966 RepID=UPI004055C356
MTAGPGSDARTGKRAAFESPTRLAEREPRPLRATRPAATAFGAALVLLRVVAGAVWLVALSIQWDTVLGEFDASVGRGTSTSTASAETLLAIVLVIGGTVLVLDLVFAVLVWFGSNWARITVMVFSTINITIAAIDSFTGDTEVTVRTTFLTVALDILILLALSSRNARAWARLPRLGRHGRTRRG